MDQIKHFYLNYLHTLQWTMLYASTCQGSHCASFLAIRPIRMSLSIKVSLIKPVKAIQSAYI